MRATVMYGAGDVRVENVPDASLVAPTDALVRVTRAAICGGDMWPYNQMQPNETGQRMGHEFIGVVDAIGAEVRIVKPATLSSRRTRGPMAPASFARKDCTPRASTAAGGPATASTQAKARRFVFPRQTERSSFCRSVPKTR